jgi:hypothetical protein
MAPRGLRKAGELGWRAFDGLAVRDPSLGVGQRVRIGKRLAQIGPDFTVGVCRVSVRAPPSDGLRMESRINEGAGKKPDISRKGVTAVQ